MNLDIYDTGSSIYQVALLRVKFATGSVVIKTLVKLAKDAKDYKNIIPKKRYFSYESAQKALDKMADDREYRWIGRNDAVPILEGEPGNLQVIGKMFV